MYITLETKKAYWDPYTSNYLYKVRFTPNWYRYKDRWTGLDDWDFVKEEPYFKYTKKWGDEYKIIKGILNYARDEEINLPTNIIFSFTQYAD